MSHDELPNTDPDRRLAVALGTRLSADDARSATTAHDDAASEDDARLLEWLEQGRADRLAAIEGPPSAAMWETISGSIRRRPAARIYRLGSWRIAGVAAAVVILVAFAVIRLAQPEFRTLLESGSERAVYTTADGTTITLRPNSRLRMNRDDVLEVVGEGYFSVAPQDSREFVVVTSDVSVAVLGTRFTVATWSGETKVFLEEGRIRLDALSGGASETLVPGDARRVDAGGTIRSVETDSVEALDWLRNELSFASQPLGTIVAELAHHFDLTIVVPPEDAGVELSGRILLSSHREALDDLAIILDAEFVERDGAFRLERRAQ